MDGAEPQEEQWTGDSGPFCRHWSDPSDCEEKCGGCGCWCRGHDEDGECRTAECLCDGWEDEE